VAFHSSIRQTDHSIIRLDISLGAELVEVLGSWEVALLDGDQDGCKPTILPFVDVQLLGLQVAD